MTISLRVPEGFLARLNEAYAKSYAEHRLSKNSWLVRILEIGASGYKEP